MEAIWESNPTVNMLYCFEDGNCFIKHGDASSHARTTGKSYVVKVRETEQEEKQPTKTNKK